MGGGGVPGSSSKPSEQFLLWWCLPPLDSTDGLKISDLMAAHSCDEDLVEDFNDAEEGAFA